MIRKINKQVFFSVLIISLAILPCFKLFASDIPDPPAANEDLISLSELDNLQSPWEIAINPNHPIEVQQTMLQWPISIINLAGQEVIMMSYDFSGNDISRALYKKEVQLDLSGVSTIEMDMLVTNPATLRNGMTIYLKSGNGWYSSTAISDGEMLWTKIRLSRCEFVESDNPGGWDNITEIRFAPVAMAREAGDIYVANFGFLPPNCKVAILQQEIENTTASVDYIYNMKAYVHNLMDSGIIPLPVSSLDYDQNPLGNDWTIFLPYMPQIRNETVSKLCMHINNGGKLVAIDDLHPDIAQCLGVQLNSYGGITGRGDLLKSGNISPFIPESIPLRDTLIAIPEALTGDGEIFAQWKPLDSATTYPGAYISSKGAYIPIRARFRRNETSLLLLGVLSCFNGEVIEKAVDHYLNGPGWSFDCSWSKVFAEIEAFPSYPKSKLHIKFDENIGSIFAEDSSDSNNHGTLTNMNPLSDWVYGKFGNALDFDGIDDYVNCGNFQSLQLTEDLTLALWIKPSNIEAGRSNPLYKAYYGEFCLTIEPTGRLSYYHGSSTSNYFGCEALPPGTIQNDIWQNIVITRDAVNRVIKAYYNGELKNTISYSADKDPASSEEPVLIGKGYTGAFAGQIDDVQIYNCLSTFKALHLKFDEEAGDAYAKDFSGNGNHGVLTNMDSQSDWVSGKSGNALDFDGVNDFVDCGNACSLQSTGDLTLAFWIKPNNIETGRSNPLDKAYYGEFCLTIEPTGRLSYYHGSSTSNYFGCEALPPGTIQNDIWQNIVITRDAANRVIKAYYNGELKNTISYSADKDPAPSEEPVLIGKGYTGAFAGQIDDVQIYNYCMPVEIMVDIANLYKEQQNYQDALDLLIQAKNLVKERYVKEWKMPDFEFFATSIRDDMPIDQLIPFLKASHITDITINVGSGTASAYSNSIKPQWIEYRYTDPDFITERITAFANAGIKVWIERQNLVTTQEHLASTEFATLSQENRLTVSVTGATVDGWLCPTHPDAITEQCALMVEAAQLQGVQGVIFDLIRYTTIPDTCYCSRCKNLFEQRIGQTVNWNQDVAATGQYHDEWLQFRADNITNIVQAASAAVRNVRPDIKIMACVFSNYPNCKYNNGQDWKLWVQNGYVDKIGPMNYIDGADAFVQMVNVQSEILGGNSEKLYPGIGLTEGLGTIEALRQISGAQGAGVNGVYLFAFWGAYVRTVFAELDK